MYLASIFFFIRTALWSVLYEVQANKYPILAICLPLSLSLSLSFPGPYPVVTREESKKEKGKEDVKSGSNIAPLSRWKSHQAGR